MSGLCDGPGCGLSYMLGGGRLDGVTANNGAGSSVKSASRDLHLDGPPPGGSIFGRVCV